MPFNTLVMVCPTSNKTSFSGTGSKVSMTPNSNEKVFFFDIGMQAVANSLLRQDWGMKDDEPLCDGIIYYTDVNQNKTIICLVELKGRQLNHALDQVVHTQKVMRQVLKETLAKRASNPHFSNVIWRGYIYQNKSAPSNIKLLQGEIEKAEKKFGGTQNFQISKAADIGVFLRK